MVKMFVDEWFRLLAYCNSDGFDARYFQVMHDNYAKAWKKQDYSVQGEISYRIQQRHKEEYGL